MSDVNIANVDSEPRQVSVVYFDGAGTAVGRRDANLGAGQTLSLPDVVQATFGVAAGRGSLRIVSDPPGGLVVQSRTYNVGAAGTFGQGVPGVAVTEGISAGRGLISLIGLNNSRAYRTNLGVTEVTGSPVRVGLALIDRTGTNVLGYREFDLGANAQFQANLFGMLGLDGVDTFAATAVMQVISGEGRVLAYASAVDNATGDATTILPPERITK